MNRGGHRSEFHGEPLVQDGSVFVGTDSGKSGAIWAFDIVTGKLKWRAEVTDDHQHQQGVSTAIVPIPGAVCGASFDDEILCVDSKAGSVRWRFQGSGTPSRASSRPSPAALKDRILYPGLDGTVYALDPVKGRVLWKRKLSKRIHTSIVADAESTYVGTDDGKLYRLSSRNGAIRGSIELGERAFFTPLLHAGAVYVFTGTDESNHLLKVDGSLKRVLWRQTAEGGWASPRPYLFGTSIVVGTEKGKVVALNATTGAVKWSEHLGGVIRAIGIDGDVLYAGALSGKVTAIRPPAAAH